MSMAKYHRIYDRRNKDGRDILKGFKTSVLDGRKLQAKEYNEMILLDKVFRNNEEFEDEET